MVTAVALAGHKTMASAGDAPKTSSYRTWKKNSSIFEKNYFLCSFFAFFASNRRTILTMREKEKAFSEIVKRYKNTVFTVCYLFSKDQEEANDLFQETLINLWRGFDAFQGKCDIKTWIWRVSFNTCLTFERKKKRSVETVPLNMDINLFTDTDDDTRQIQQLYHRINRLGVVDRAIILLWLENMSYEEIGQIIGISTKNVSVKLVRIKEQLKKMSNE